MQNQRLKAVGYIKRRYGGAYVDSEQGKVLGVNGYVRGRIIIGSGKLVSPETGSA